MALDVEKYYLRYGNMVMRRCRALLKDEDLAVDATQDTFVALLRNRKKLKDQAPSCLLYTMATNICLNRLRKEKRALPLTPEQEHNLRSTEDIEAVVVARDLLARLFRRRQIKPSTKQIAVQVYLHRSGISNTAQDMNMSPSGIRKRLRILRSNLVTVVG